MNEQLQQALNKTYFYLKFRPRSKKEVVDYLNKKLALNRIYSGSGAKKTVKEVIKILEAEGLINDLKFVEWIVHARSKIKPKGEGFLKRELIAKFGVDNFLVEDFFAQNPVDEEKSVKELLVRRWSRWSSLDKRERFKKAVAFLQRKGFNYPLIKKIISEIEVK